MVLHVSGLYWIYPVYDGEEERREQTENKNSTNLKNLNVLNRLTTIPGDRKSISLISVLPYNNYTWIQEEYLPDIRPTV